MTVFFRRRDEKVALNSVNSAKTLTLCGLRQREYDADVFSDWK